MRVLIKRLHEGDTELWVQKGWLTCDVCSDDAGTMIVVSGAKAEVHRPPVAICTRCIKKAKADLAADREERRR